MGWLTLLRRRRHRLHIQTYFVEGEIDCWINFYVYVCAKVLQFSSGYDLHAEQGRVPR